MSKKTKGRTLTVKGIGNIDIRPDWVTISIFIEEKNEIYEKSVEAAAEAVEALSEALGAVGFEETALKTASWECGQVFKSIEVTKKGFREQETENKRVFDCYKTRHVLNLEYSFDEKELPVVIGAIANCSSVFEFDIKFTIKDKAAAADRVLEAATKDALKKAGIITQAAGLELGKQKTIFYNLNARDFYSKTRISPRSLFDNLKYYSEYEDNEADFNFRDTGIQYLRASHSFNIEPETIKLRDAITFVWEIL